MSRSHSTTLLVMIIMISLLFFSLTNAARLQPMHPKDSSSSLMTTQNEDVNKDDHDHEEIIDDDNLGDGIISCDEGVGEEECKLMRRTLVAHTDYIYTQKKKNP